MDTSLKQKLKESGYKGDFNLESLIDACGDGFRELVLHSVREDGHKWHAKSGKINGNFIKNGKTPSIAVAKLLLELSENTPKNAVKELWERIKIK